MRARILVLLVALAVLAAPAAPAPASDAALRATVGTYLGRLLTVVNAIDPADRPSVVRAGTRMIRISTSARRALARRAPSSASGRRGKAKARKGFAQFAAAGRDIRASGRAAPARAERLIGLAAGHMARGQALLGEANRLLGAKPAGRTADDALGDGPWHATVG